MEGRKFPLVEIRKTKLHKLEEYMHVNGDIVMDRLTMLNHYERRDSENEEEMKERAKFKEMGRTRHLMMWHDLSTVANHSHLVFMYGITCFYYQATFYTSTANIKSSNRKMNIQSLVVEAPSLYLVARSSSCDENQSSYVETRLACLQELSKPTTITTSDTPVADNMRFFHGDSTSRQYEAGKQTTFVRA